ncbi:MAG: PhzF family phenazine biosynthesis protein [Gammaproteobacteria bacterium]|nr:PhzF family phenazine biosynthesis protein [Gammaproteobacteria bacterium]
MGNPVGVVLDCADLTVQDMQMIARWANLSETTFLLPPEQGGDYRIRIFTPVSELPFAGHPAIGTVHAALESGVLPGGKGEYVQECAAGLLRVRTDQAGPVRNLFVQAPARHIGRSKTTSWTSSTSRWTPTRGRPCGRRS